MLKKNYKSRISLNEVALELKTNISELYRKLEEEERVFRNLPNIECTNVSGRENPLNQTIDEAKFSYTKKYLKFFHSKHKLLLMLGNLLMKFKYPFLSNSHKLLLVFLSSYIYKSSIHQLQHRMSKNKIIISEDMSFNAD